jgi:LysR family transcriptional regulator, transcriptional activator for dmlA
LLLDIYYHHIVDNLPLLSDLRLFYAAARRSSFVATAAELGASPAFVSKRIAILEKTLSVTLFHRTTRRVAITEEGEEVYQWAQKILEATDGSRDEHWPATRRRCVRSDCGLGRDGDRSCTG